MALTILKYSLGPLIQPRQPLILLARLPVPLVLDVRPRVHNFYVLFLELRHHYFTFMGHGDFILYRNAERNFEVSNKER